MVLAELGQRVEQLLHTRVSRKEVVKGSGKGIAAITAANLIREVFGTEVVHAQGVVHEVPDAFSFYGLPASVEGSRVDGFADQAPTFRRSPELPAHLGINFKEPGKIIYDRNLIPAGELARFDELVRIAGGAAEYKNEENEILFISPEVGVTIHNGGLGLFTFEEGWLELLGTWGLTGTDENVWLDFWQKPFVRLDGSTTQQTAARWLVGIRGWHGDVNPGEKPNLTIVSHMTVLGNAKFTRYPNRPAGGFISVDQLLQKRDHVLQQQPQLQETRYAAIDVNTGAFGVAVQPVAGGRPAGSAILIATNIR